MKLRYLVGFGDPWQCFAKYYAKVGQVTPVYATRLLVMLNEPKQLLYHLQRNDDSVLAQHIANICDERSPFIKDIKKIFSASQMAVWCSSYQQLLREGVNFERFFNPFYTFQKIQRRDGQQSSIARAYQDPHDFMMNQKLLDALRLDTCPATTSEGRALWTYTKLCSVLKYDEGYMYHEYRDNLNDYPDRSFELVEQVTPATPITCYNFSRIAVKLLNQIPGIKATIIALGKNLGHFRFGFYSDKMSVDIEAINAVGSFNDLARAKLGMPPKGIKAIYGENLVNHLLAEVVTPWLKTQPQPITQYLTSLKKIPSTSSPTPIDFPMLLKTLQAHNITGTDALQVMLNMNVKFAQERYVMARAGTVTKQGVTPYLFVRQGEKIIAVDLEKMNIEPCDADLLRRYLAKDAVVYADDDHTLGDLCR